MKRNLALQIDSTELLYAHGFVYQRYDETERHLGLFFPFRREWDTDERFPLVVFIPGAAWRRQEMQNDVPKYSRLAQRGCVMAVVQVRESDLAPFPAQIEDIHRAVAWLLDHAQQFHIDPNRIFFMGNSSGGHLALISAFTKAHGLFVPEDVPSYCVRGVITHAASSDLRLCMEAPWPAERGIRPVVRLMGTESEMECLHQLHSATCKNYVTASIPLPKTLLFHFSHDPVVSSRMSSELYDALVCSGHQADYYEIAGCEHGGNGYWTNEILDITHKFITC